MQYFGGVIQVIAAMGSARQQKVHCAEHGISLPCMICRHLRERKKLGYVLIAAVPGEFCETALCEACERLLLEEDGWTNHLFDHANWQLYGEVCFRRELRRRRHHLVGRGRLASEAGVRFRTPSTPDRTEPSPAVACRP